MGQESYIIVERLKNHIRDIISKYEIVISENNTLKEELSLCKTELETNKNNIKELEEKIERLQLVKAFVASGDARETKQKIGRLVKEIDKCIAMLND